MRCDEVARGVVAALEPLEGDAEDAPLVSPGLLLGALLLGDVLLGAMPFGGAVLGDVLLDASAGVELGVVVVVLLPDVLDPLLGVG